MPDSREQKIELVPFGYKIKAGGMFDFEELYQEMQRWVTYNGYTWQETKYRLVENPDGSRQVELKWVCPKQMDSYVKFTIKMDLQVFHSDVEANIDGIKRKLSKGSFEFRFHAYYEKNWKGFWKDANKGWGKFKKNFYEKVIIKSRMEDLEVEMFKEAHMFFDEVRAYMKLYGTE